MIIGLIINFFNAIIRFIIALQNFIKAINLIPGIVEDLQWLIDWIFSGALFEKIVYIIELLIDIIIGNDNTSNQMVDILNLR